MKKLEIALKTSGQPKARLHHLSKIILLVMLTFALCIGMTACGAGKDKTQLTIAQIIEANSSENLFNHYTSIHLNDTEIERYLEPELFYEMDVNETIQTPNNAYGFYEGQYLGMLTPGGIWAMKSKFFSYMGVNPDATALEEVTKVENNGDTLTVHTVISTDVFATIAETLDFEYKDGVYLECIYTLDAKTLAILDAINNYCYADGTKEKESHITLTYNGPRPKGAEALLERLSDPQKLRTVTLVANPDTKDESICSVKIPKGEKVMFSSYNNEVWMLYSDFACTETYVGGADLNEDFTIYCKKN